MSQGAAQVPTAGPVTPATFAGDINTALLAILSKNSGTSAPSNVSGSPLTYQTWADTTVSTEVKLNIYDGTNWLPFGALDGSAHVFKPLLGGGTEINDSTGGSLNNWNPGGTFTTDLTTCRVKLNFAGSYTITGLAGGQDGRVVFFHTGTGTTATFSNNSGSSIAANRFGINRDLIMPPRSAVAFFYSSNNSEWRVFLNAGAIFDGPTFQNLTTGTGATYTTPAGCIRLRIRMIGGGASGAANNNTNGTSGSNTSFGGVSAAGGGKSTVTGDAGPGGTGGTGTLGITKRYPGNAGGSAAQLGAGANNTYGIGGAGADSPFGGGGRCRGGTNTGTANSAAANTGAGGSGQGALSSSNTPGGGGGSGEVVEIILNNPAATYTYTVGAGGATGGGNGGSGIIQVEEYYE